MVTIFLPPSSHYTCCTTWTDPLTLELIPLDIMEWNTLPPGWERFLDSQGDIYYVKSVMHRHHVVTTPLHFLHPDNPCSHHTTHSLPPLSTFCSHHTYSLTSSTHHIPSLSVVTTPRLLIGSARGEIEKGSYLSNSKNSSRHRKTNLEYVYHVT